VESNQGSITLRKTKLRRHGNENNTIACIWDDETTINSVTNEEAKTQIERYRETEVELSKISSVFDTKEFCDRLISAVNVAMVYHDDIDQWSDERKVSSIIMNEQHSKAKPEELAHKWNIGIQTAKDTMRVTTQCGIRMALHLMTRHV
jgi:hypothetical protein